MGPVATMSGGSYAYLYAKPVNELVSWDREVESMVDRLAGLGYAEDAARESMEFLLELRRARVRLETMQQRLAPVWKAVEWWDSADSGEDEVKDALVEYRDA